MNRYIATFHTHFSAMATFRALRKAGFAAEMTPVPRALSADCGSSVRFDAESDCRALMHADFDRIVRVRENGDYETLVKNDAP